jgi:hypothetical protein
MLSPYPSLDGSDLFSEAETIIPYIVEEIGSSLGFVSSLVSSEISSPLEEGSFMPRFKRKRGVPQLRQSFKSFVQNFKSFHPAHLPEPGTVLFPIIFRGEKRSYASIPFHPVVMLFLETITVPFSAWYGQHRSRTLVCFSVFNSPILF